MQSFNAHGHQPCSCTALDFCTARGLQPIRTRPAVSSINHPWPHYYFPYTTFVQCESCYCTVSTCGRLSRPDDHVCLSSCLNEIADCSASICSLLKACRILQNRQTFAMFLSSLPSLKCTCSSTIKSLPRLSTHLKQIRTLKIRPLDSTRGCVIFFLASKQQSCE